jgi:hypothetical protein
MFDLDKEQLEKLAEWKGKHTKAFVGAIGGRYTYSFSPTSLGVVVKVKDEITKEEIDLTDYLSW